MHIVLDANAIVSEGFGNSRQFKALLSVANALGYTIVVPQVVVDEVVARFSKSLEAEVEAVRSRLAKLSNWMSRSLESPIGVLNVADETESFKRTLLKKFEDANVVVAGYPDTPHEELVRRATSRTRPFDDNGSGYRDTLIWMTVLDLVTETGEQVVLVAADKAFRNKERPNLHRDLTTQVSDITRAGGNRVALSINLSSLVDDHIRPYLNNVPWENPLETLANLVFGAEETIALAIQEKYAHMEWDPNALGLSGDFESPTLDSASNVTIRSVEDVREYPGGGYLVKVEADFEADFGVFMYKSDWYAHEEEPHLFVVDWDWNDHGLFAGIVLSMRCSADLVVAAPEGGDHEVQAVVIETAE